MGKPTCIGASGEQALVPVIQRGQGEGLIQVAGGFQQPVQPRNQLNPSERDASRVREGICLKKLAKPNLLRIYPLSPNSPESPAGG